MAKKNIIFGILAALTAILTIGFFGYTVEESLNFGMFIIVVLLWYGTNEYYKKHIKK